MGIYNNLMWQSFVQFLIVMFLVVGIMGLATGVGLIVSTAKTVHIFRVLNRWISTRHVLRPVEVPHETEYVTRRFTRWVSGGFVVGGIISIFGLGVNFDVAGLSVVLGRGTAQPVVVIAIETVRWFLIVGSAVGVVIGVMLTFYPKAEIALERYANQWVSPRQLVGRHTEDMHMTLDRLVEANPKPSGWIMACTSAGAVIYGLIMLLR